MRTILIMAGGTAGHVMPALAVAECLVAAGWLVHWMGTPAGMENRLVAPFAYPMHPVEFSGVRGKHWRTRLMLPFTVLRALWQSMRILRRVKPAVVLGMGGYISLPGGCAARLLGYPLVIHEQNRVAGSANRVLARVANRVLESFPGSLARALLTGNPVRSSIAAIAAPGERFAPRSGRLRLVVIGGSLGAQALNECVPQALAQIAFEQRPQVVHQAGERHLDALRQAYRAAGVEGDLRAFIEDMASLYASADLVICRAGATTVAELASAGVAAILVPYPHAIDDHQSANARFLSEAGAAILLPQAELNPATLAALISELTRDRLLGMAQRARVLGTAQAAQQVMSHCIGVAI